MRHAGTYQLSEAKAKAKAIIDEQIVVIRQYWDEACDGARLTEQERGALWQRQFLNPFALEGY